MQNEEQKIVTLDDLLNRFNKQNKSFIQNIEKEEELERVETLEAMQNDIAAQKNHTENLKERFAKDMLNGLGEKVKYNPNKVKKIEKSFGTKFKEFIKKIFTRF
jgi:hypothetical protein